MANEKFGEEIPGPNRMKPLFAELGELTKARAREVQRNELALTVLIVDAEKILGTLPP